MRRLSGHPHDSGTGARASHESTGHPRPVFCKRGRLQDYASRGRLAHYGACAELRPSPTAFHKGKGVTHSPRSKRSGEKLSDSPSVMDAIAPAILPTSFKMLKLRKLKR